MRRLAAGCAALILLAGASSAAATPLQNPSKAITNQDVVKMVAAGLAEDVVITAVRQAPTRNFDLTPSGLIELKLAHVPDAVIRVMQGSGRDETRAPEPPPAAPPPPDVVPVPPPPPPPPPPARSAGAEPRPAKSETKPSNAVAIHEPTVPGELYGVSSTGALVALERVQMKDRKVGGPRSQGVFKPSVQDFAYYFDGSSSPVTLRAADPQVFAIRLLGPSDRDGRDATAEEAQKHFLLTKLQTEEGRRYITKVDAQFDVRTFGTPTPGLDPKKPERLAVSFELTPRMVLGPGEYVILLAGTHNFEFIGNFLASSDRWAFAIVDR